MIIYKVTNKVNGKIYIGQTIRKMSYRWSQHGAKKDNGFFARAIRKYGKENFTVEILASAFTIEYLNELEIFFIKKFNSLSPNGYNIDLGGKNEKRSAETILKISLATKGRAVWNAGKKLTPEHKQKLALAKTGKFNKKSCKAIIAVSLDTHKETFFVSLKTAAKTLGVKQGNISKVLSGSRKQTGKYTFRRALENEGEING